jgi:hypothetical protein
MKNNKPVRTEAFHRGFQDFFAGRLANPYRKDSQYAKEWTHGFDVGYFENLRSISQ